MKYDFFKTIVLTLKRQDKTIKEFYDRGVFLNDFADPYYAIVTMFIKEIYGEEGYDWFAWFCYENDYGRGKLQGYVNENKEICYDIKSLYDHLESLRRKDLLNTVSKFTQSKKDERA